MHSYRQRVRMKSRSWSRNNHSSQTFNSAEKTNTCFNQVQQYLINSTFHGLRYVGDSKISFFERIFFGVSFVLVLCLSVYFISHVYEKWTASPIIITLNAVATAISDIPFPAVTICNMNQARLGVVKNWTKQSEQYLMLRSLCRRDLDLSSSKTNKTSWAYFRKFLLKVSQSCNDMLITCKFGNKWETCTDLFETVLTDEGLCCTFNGVDQQFLLLHNDISDDFEEITSNSRLVPISWTPEDGFEESASITGTFPRRGLGSGSHMGLTVLVSVISEDYYCSSTNSAGFKVLLHPPTETPKIADYGFSISPGIETRVVVSPRISNASPQIRKVPYNQRQCVFSNEGNLTYFRTYSRKNCEMECESRLLHEACGCVFYYMPRINENMSICSREDSQCSNEVQLAIELGLNSSFHCDCLPGCFEISYHPEISFAKLGSGFSVAQRYLAKSTKEQLENYSVMHVFYQDNFFRSHSKEELIGFTEFLSNTGGLLGLFMGFSVVSLIEIFYFMSIRPYCASIRNDRFKNSRKFGANNRQHTTWYGHSCPRITTVSQSLDKPFVLRINTAEKRWNGHLDNFPV